MIGKQDAMVKRQESKLNQVENQGQGRVRVQKKGSKGKSLGREVMMK